jgi:hypothetical protein
MSDRKTVLLKACAELLKKLDGGDNYFESTVRYDDADCDGFCLMMDIEHELEVEEVR